MCLNRNSERISRSLSEAKIQLIRGCGESSICTDQAASYTREYVASSYKKGYKKDWAETRQAKLSISQRSHGRRYDTWKDLMLLRAF
ncbi:MAG: hypothetical protein Q7J15_13170 [Candidatus Desulfaltia sp.]|nr:hypothetical protein [Candidatus Desulfaltia sp.]